MDIKSLYEKFRFRLRLKIPKYSDIITTDNYIDMSDLSNWGKRLVWFPKEWYSDDNIIENDDNIEVIAPTHGENSGLIISKFTFKYGTIRALLKAPDIKGVWSAFWLFDTNGMPEHDFEFCGQETHTVNVTHHWGYEYVGNDKKSTLHNARTNKHFNPTTEYNWYEIEKTPYKVIYRINGIVVKVKKRGISSGESRVIFNAGTGSYCGSEKNQPLQKKGIMYIKSIELDKVS